jgi:NitT/TauT family transport system ATP-binding protein
MSDSLVATAPVASATRDDAPVLIEMQGLSKQFYRKGAAVLACQNVNLNIRRGEFVAVVGPSGCGKSTLLNMTAGLMKTSAGHVSYGGKEVDGVNRKVGYMTQKDSLLPWSSVEKNVGLALEIAGTPGDERRRKVAEYMDLVGLKGFEKHYPAELSGGMRKRAALARTLIYDPETLLMDEPFGALDAQLKLIMHAELLKIWERTQKTILFVTHDLTEAITLADKVVVMTSRPGRIKLVQEIDIPRPRDVFSVRFTERFGELHQILWKALEEDIAHGEEN